MKTAVEYLVDEFKEKLTGDNLPDWVVKIIDKAKEMEAEQLKDFYFGGCSEMYATEKGFEEYYNETFK